MRKKPILVSTVLALAIYGFCIGDIATAQECVAAKPGNYEDLPEFQEDGNCCYQDPFERKCGDLEFCFGVMISHGSALHSSCCDLYPSCLATKTLIDTMGKLKALSLTDLCISAIICILSIAHIYFQVSGGTIGAKTQLTILSTVILVLEIVDLGISSRIIYVARHQNSEGETAAETADALIGADCFKDPRDSPKIANIHSELEKFETIQIIELAFECCLIILQIAKVICLRNQAQSTAETFDTVTIYILDAFELILAAIAYIVLVSGISDFHDVYNDMRNPTAGNACIQTCCFISVLKAGIPSGPEPSKQPPVMTSTQAPSMARPNIFNLLLQPTMKPTSKPTTTSPKYVYIDPFRQPTTKPTSKTANPSLKEVAPFRQIIVPETTSIHIGRSRLDEVKNFLLGNRVSDPASLEQFGSPQNLAMMWIADKDTRNVSVSDALFVQRYSLAVLYFATGGADWDNNRGWLEGGLECEWHGVNDNYGIDDSSNRRKHRLLNQTYGMEDHIHSNEISSIDLDSNSLHGTLPEEMGALPKLRYLDLSSNCIIGPIPPQMGNLEKLRILRLEANDMTGTFPVEFLAMTSLTELYLYYNDFIDKVPTNSTLCKRKGEMYTTLDCEQCPEWDTVLSAGPCCDTCWYWWADKTTC